MAASNTLSEDKAREILDIKAKEVDENVLGEVVERESVIKRKLQDVPSSLQRLANRVKLLFEMLRDYRNKEYRSIPWNAVAMGVAAILYFIAPTDFIPDFVPGVGFIDDTLMIGLTIKALEKDLRRYCLHKGYEANQYFE